MAVGASVIDACESESEIAVAHSASCMSEAELELSMRRHVHVNEFEQWQKQLGVRFTLDAFCDDAGVNSMTKAYCSPPSNPFCAHQLQDSDVVWLHPPAGAEEAYVSHYLQQKFMHTSLSAALLLPASCKIPALKGMRHVKRYFGDAKLLRCMLPDRSWSWYPLTEPLDLWYDCPNNSATLPEASHVISAMQADDDVFWVHALIAGSKAERMLLDTGANCNFLSTTIVERLNLRMRPCNQYIQLPDGSVTRAMGCVDVILKLAGCHLDGQCVVCDLNMDLGLGQVLDVGAAEVRLSKPNGHCSVVLKHKMPASKPSL